MEVLFTRRRITADEFERMGVAGVFGEDDRLELIEGEIVEMTAQGSRHVACILALTELLSATVAPQAIVSVQNAVRLNDSTVPQPDIAVLRRRPYREHLPAPDDTLLVVAVADSSVLADRSGKLPRYAAAGIREAWLVDVNAERVERHTEPGPTGYGMVAPAGRGQSLPSIVLPALVLDVDAVLGYGETESE